MFTLADVRTVTTMSRAAIVRDLVRGGLLSDTREWSRDELETAWLEKYAAPVAAGAN